MPGVTTRRQPSGTGFALRDALPWKELSPIVRAAEPAGYTAVFLPEITGRDALLTLGMFAGETRRLLLGTGVLPIRSRTPLLTAMGAAAVQERSDGRLILGLGTGDAGPGALDELRETVGRVRRLLRGEDLEDDEDPRRLSLPLGRTPVEDDAVSDLAREPHRLGPQRGDPDRHVAPGRQRETPRVLIILEVLAAEQAPNPPDGLA